MYIKFFCRVVIVGIALQAIVALDIVKAETKDQTACKKYGDWSWQYFADAF